MQSCGFPHCQSRKALLKRFFLVKHDLIQDREVILTMENVGNDFVFNRGTAPDRTTRNVYSLQSTLADEWQAEMR